MPGGTGGAVRPQALLTPARAEVVVAGFWRRFAAALVDLAVLAPATLVFILIVGRIVGLSLPPTKHATIDYWLDLALAGDPALWGGFGLVLAIATVYVVVFQATLARTLGMRVMRLTVIDVYGEAPTPWRVAARTAGYWLGVATLGLGFVWIGFDREKRGLHDWIAGTYVIRSDGRRSKAP
jgi:uncharacterized RDD family membrane protein YckC